jgi:hypothetical protein
MMTGAKAQQHAPSAEIITIALLEKKTPVTIATRARTSAAITDCKHSSAVISAVAPVKMLAHANVFGFMKSKTYFSQPFYGCDMTVFGI